MPTLEQLVFAGVEDADADQYSKLTFPAYRYLLSSSRTNEVIAVGARFLNEPVGLALGRMTEDQSSGILLSVAVQSPHRSQGVGTRLVRELEKMFRARGAAKLSIVYMGGNPSVESLEKLLRRRDWTPPKPRMLLCRGQIHKVMQSEFLRKQVPVRGLVISTLDTIAEEDRSEIMGQTDSGFPHLLKSLERPVQDETSLAAYQAGKLAGWIVTHRISADTLRYSRLYVSRKQRQTVAASFLITEAVRRQHLLVRDQGQPREAIFDTELDNRPMINFIRRRLLPCTESSSVTLGSFKLLSPSV
jgi:GNAT superfamily N-acetyltransferase